MSDPQPAGRQQSAVPPRGLRHVFTSGDEAGHGGKFESFVENLVSQDLSQLSLTYSCTLSLHFTGVNTTLLMINYYLLKK